MISRIISIFISAFLLLEPSRAIAGDVPVSVPGKSQSPKCQTSSNANSTAKSSVTKSASKACQAGDGLSQESAGSSAWQIKRDYPNSSSGLYWIKNTSINGGVPFQIYADMATDNGGWTLIVANSIFGWNSSEAFLNNQNNPPTDPSNLIAQSGKYSILSYADYLKKSSSGFQYRIDAREIGKCGGIWTANSNYSFTSGNPLNTNITLNSKWGYGNATWIYNDNGIEERMPYLVSPGNYALLTTSFDPNNTWWGTIIQAINWEGGSASVTTPWISYGGWGDQSYLPPSEEPCARPSIIWYWVR